MPIRYIGKVPINFYMPKNKIAQTIYFLMCFGSLLLLMSGFIKFFQHFLF
jgi:hypothetical protein